MRRVWTLGLLTGSLLCMVSACTDESTKQSQPNSGFEGKPELKPLPPPGAPGGGQGKKTGGNAPKAE